MRQITATAPREGKRHSAVSTGEFKASAFVINASSKLFVSFVSPIRVLRVLQVPERATAAHNRQSLEVVLGGRRGGRPFERPRVPRVFARRLSFPVRPNEVDDKAHDSRRLRDHSHRGGQVIDLPATALVIGVNAARHAEDAGEVLRVECKVESDGEQPEMPEPQPPVEHPSDRLWVPVIDPGEDPEEESADERVMEMSYDEVGIM